MKQIAGVSLLFLLLCTACKNDDELRQIESAKALKAKELVFNAINKAWVFAPRNLSPESQSISNSWNDWRLFIDELNQKPKGTIGAFQRKTKSLVQKSETLNNSIPEKINKPQVRSRLMAMITKVKALNTFLNLDNVPEKKVVELVTDLNVEVNAIQDQIEEIVRRSNIQLEEGEAEMLNAIKGQESLPMTPATIPPSQPQPQQNKE
jgi:hypothetical protein